MRNTWPGRRSVKERLATVYKVKERLATVYKVKERLATVYKVRRDWPQCTR